MSFRFGALASLTAVTLLSGCALLGGGPGPQDTYSLTAPSVPEGPRRGRIQILVAEPAALRALDGENIVIAPAPGEIQFLSGAQWADRLPRVVQVRLAEAFQSSGRFGGVGRPGEGLAIDYQVVTEIRRFEIDVTAGNVATVEIFAKILNDRNGTVRASRRFLATAPLSGAAGNAAYVDALDSAFTQVGRDMVDWVSGAI